eukprot:4360636-Amphidinium_carterae.1
MIFCSPTYRCALLFFASAHFGPYGCQESTMGTVRIAQVSCAKALHVALLFFASTSRWVLAVVLKELAPVAAGWPV